MDEARAQIRKESEQYGCAKDQKSAGSLEIKKSIDSRQTNCLSWCDEKESHAHSCVQLVCALSLSPPTQEMGHCRCLAFTVCLSRANRREGEKDKRREGEK